jgi:hypothetical protein
MKSVRLGALAVILTLAGLSAVSAAAQDAPKRKAGKWDIAVATSGQPPFASQVCIDDKDDIAKSAGTSVQQSECESASVRREGEKYIVESVCKQRNSTVTTRAVLSGSFDSAYSGEVETNYNPPLYGRTQVKATVEAKLLGPC